MFVAESYQIWHWGLLSQCHLEVKQLDYFRCHFNTVSFSFSSDDAVTRDGGSAFELKDGPIRSSH